MHLINVVDGEDTKRVFVYLICPNDSEDENYAKSLKLFFYYSFFMSQWKRLFAYAAVLKHIWATYPLESSSETYVFTEKFVYHFRSFLDILKLIEVLLLDFSENKTTPVIVILFEIAAH